MPGVTKPDQRRRTWISHRYALFNSAASFASRVLSLYDMPNDGLLIRIMTIKLTKARKLRPTNNGTVGRLILSKAAFSTLKRMVFGCSLSHISVTLIVM